MARLVLAAGVMPSVALTTTRRRSRRRVWIALALVVCGLLTGVAAWIARPSSVPFTAELLRQRIVDSLSGRLDADVDLDAVAVQMLPRFHAEARGLKIRSREHRNNPPLIAIRTVTIDADLSSLRRRHVNQVALTGLDITIVPTHDEGGRRSTIPNPRDVVIDQLTASDARLIIIPQEKDKTPKTWAIHSLALQSVSFDRRMPFEATLTNAVPPGEIDVRGHFGPWQPVHAELTPLDGRFEFADANLGVFKGVSGRLRSHGDFNGTLGKIVVVGRTDVPDFTVAVGGHPVPLHADYHTTVDGTNGDTLLDRIDASFLKTSFVAKGGVVDTPGRQGRTVTLDIRMDNARLEDILRLAVKTPKPPMVGALKLQTRFVLPPGDVDVVQKLQLAGQFAIASGRFESPLVQQKIDELSRRGRGKSADAPGETVTSNFLGRFKLGRGALALESLTFETPGAKVELAGSYGLRSEALDFKGMLLLDATISQTQTGWKRLLFKQVDPFFERKEGGGTALPIKITGPRSQPAFGLDRRRLLRPEK